MFDKRVYRIAAIAVLLLAPVFATGPTWIPDVTFKATSLAGWHVLGQADWKVQNGEVVGTAKPGGGGGWLVLDRSYQDPAFYAAFHCTDGCQTGVLLRAEKTAQGMKGIFVSLTEGDVATYRVTLGPDGQELSREPLRAPGGEGAARRGARGGAGARGGRAVAALAAGPAAPKDLPMSPPRPGLHPGEWNEVEVFLDATIIRTFLNDSHRGNPAARWTRRPAATGRWRSTSAVRAKCVSRTSRTRIWAQAGSPGESFDPLPDAAPQRVCTTPGPPRWPISTTMASWTW